MSMKEIIEWLQEIEKRTENLYKEAGRVFKEDDPELSSLIKHLAAEEAEHLKCMAEVSGFISSIEVPENIIEFNRETKEDIEGYFRECEESLKTGELTTKKMMDLIVNTEFSEFNDIFLYMVKLVKASPLKGCTSSIISMQRHKERVKEFIEARDDCSECLEIINNIPDIWNESILIVDDEKVILDVLENVLVEGKLIEKAANGEEALQKLGEKYFAAIITDIRMPVMDGIEFYKKAKDKFPNIGERFIFFTASTDPEKFKFFRENGLQWIEKPSPIGEIKKVVREVIDRASD
jgi:CheY-like chemotaxis protein